MKKIFLILFISAFLISCEQNNTKVPENQTQTGATENKTETKTTEKQSDSETIPLNTENLSENEEKQLEVSKYVIDNFYKIYPNVMKNFDKETLVLVTNFDPNQGNYFLKDKNGVYLLQIIEKTIKTLEWADINTFHFDQKNYIYKDKNFIYNAETGEKYDIDIKTYKGLGYNIMKDEKNIFINGKKVPEIEAKNFQEVWDFGIFYKNDTSVYYFDYHQELVPLNVDINSFKPLGLYAFKDKTAVYFYLNNIVQKQPQFDLKTFEALNFYYFKDKNGIYALDGGVSKITKVEDADVATFEIIDDGYSIEPSIIDSRKAKDKNNVYEYWIKE